MERHGRCCGRFFIAFRLSHAARRAPSDVVRTNNSYEYAERQNFEPAGIGEDPRGAMPQPFERIGARHYWLQIVRDGKTVDQR